MVRTKRRKGPRRIAIAIQMDDPFPHHTGCYHGIVDYANQKENWHTVVDPYLVGLSSHCGVLEYDGIVGRITREVAEEAKSAGIPVVNHWMNSPARGVPGVYSDFAECGRIAAEHLLARGYRRFGYVGWKRDRVRTFHLSGFEPPLQEQGMAIQHLIVPMSLSSHERGSGRMFTRFNTLLRDWLSGLTPPFGLYIPIDTCAMYALQMCDELGLRVPHDVGIVSGFNNPTICLKTKPTLSAIEPDNERVGYRATQLLDRLMDGEEAPDEPIWIPPKTLRMRGSSDAFVCEDPTTSRALRYIADHSRESITVKEVAKAAKTTTRTLARRFEQFVGHPIRKEISRMRIESLKRILIDSKTPISTVAIQCGFTSASHFTEFFKKETGITPGEYRKQHQS